MRQFNNIKTPDYEIEVYACDCGCAMGVDVGLLERATENVWTQCLNCGATIVIGDKKAA